MHRVVRSGVYVCRWNQLDVLIVVMSVVGIALEEVRSGIIPINPTIIRVMRVLRIARGDSVNYSLISTNVFKYKCVYLFFI